MKLYQFTLILLFAFNTLARSEDSFDIRAYDIVYNETGREYFEVQSILPDGKLDALGLNRVQRKNLDPTKVALARKLCNTRNICVNRRIYGTDLRPYQVLAMYPNQEFVVAIEGSKSGYRTDAKEFAFAEAGYLIDQKSGFTFKIAHSAMSPKGKKVEILGIFPDGDIIGKYWHNDEVVLIKAEEFEAFGSMDCGIFIEHPKVSGIKTCNPFNTSDKKSYWIETVYPDGSLYINETLRPNIRIKVSSEEFLSMF